MKKIILTFVFFFAFSTLTSAQIKCPNFKESELFNQGEIIGKIQACIDARKNGQENTITEYRCPGGEQSFGDKTPFNNETLAYLIAGELMMKKVDKKVEIYMKQLQKSRDKNAIAWTENYGKCLYGQTEKDVSVSNIYNQICQPTYIIHFLNKNQEKPIISHKNVFPQTHCKDTANKKMLGWEKMASFMMHDGINKSYQNDMDYFMEEIFGKYKKILDKFHEYEKLLSKAASKMTKYITNPVK